MNKWKSLLKKDAEFSQWRQTGCCLLTIVSFIFCLRRLHGYCCYCYYCSSLLLLLLVYYNFNFFFFFYLIIPIRTPCIGTALFKCWWMLVLAAEKFVCTHQQWWKHFRLTVQNELWADIIQESWLPSSNAMYSEQLQCFFNLDIFAVGVCIISQ